MRDLRNTSVRRGVEIELDRLVQAGEADVLVRRDGKVLYRLLPAGPWWLRCDIIPSAVATIALWRAKKRKLGRDAVAGALGASR